MFSQLPPHLSLSPSLSVFHSVKFTVSSSAFLFCHCLASKLAKKQTNGEMSWLDESACIPECYTLLLTTVFRFLLLQTTAELVWRVIATQPFHSTVRLVTLVICSLLWSRAWGSRLTWRQSQTAHGSSSVFVHWLSSYCWHRTPSWKWFIKKETNNYYCSLIVDNTSS